MNERTLRRKLRELVSQRKAITLQKRRASFELTDVEGETLECRSAQRKDTFRLRLDRLMVVVDGLEEIESLRRKGWTLNHAVMEVIAAAGLGDEVMNETYYYHLAKVLAGTGDVGARRTFLLFWNGNEGDAETLRDGAEQLESSGIFESRWSTGIRTDLPAGSHVYLMRVGKQPRGIVAAGVTLTEPERDPDYEKRNLVDVAWTTVLELDRPLPLRDLQRSAPKFGWAAQNALELPEALASKTGALWHRWLQTDRAATRAGRRMDPVTRRAVEEYAMERATKHFSLEYEVTRQGKPFDLDCRRGRERLQVEVKGTTLSGRRIQLTRNEVELHTKHAKRMALFITHSIELDGKGRPRGGVDRIILPWRLDPSHIEAVQYEYDVPEPSNDDARTR